MSDTFALTQPPAIDVQADVSAAGEFFADFIELLQAQLISVGVDDSAASDMTNKIVRTLALAFAGETFYVARKPAVFARQMAMYADAQTMRSYDVDKKYGVSKGYTLKIVKKIEQMRQHREQLKFDF